MRHCLENLLLLGHVLKLDAYPRKEILTLESKTDVRMPTILKRTIFLEFPIYVFDPAKHADQSKVQVREAEEGQRDA